MGYDLILTAAPVEADYGEARRRVGRLSELELREVAEACLPWFEDWPYEARAEEVRQAILGALDAVANPLPRDVAVLVFGEKSYYITGGLSYGDNPTESFDSLELIRVAGITDDDAWAEREEEGS